MAVNALVRPYKRGLRRRRAGVRGCLERVSYTEVEGGVFPAEVMYPSFACGVVGVVELNTPVESQDDELDIETQSESGIETELFVETVEVEYALGGDLCLVHAEIPYVAEVEERCAVEHAPDGEPEFEVCLQTHVSHLYGVWRILDDGIAGAEGSGHPSAHAVAAADIEEAVEGQGAGVAVGDAAAGEDTTREGGLLAEDYLAADADVAAHILRVPDAEDIVVSALDLVRECPLEEVEQVARRLEVYAHERGVAVDVLVLVVVDVRSRKPDYGLCLVALAEVFVAERVEEALVEVSDIDPVEVYGAYLVVVSSVYRAPRVCPRRAREVAAVIWAVLVVERQFDLRAGHVDLARGEAERKQEAREREPDAETYLVGLTLDGVGGLHVLISYCYGGVEGLDAAEEVAVLVSYRRAQTVEARCGAPLKLDIESLPQRGGAEHVAAQVALAYVLEGGCGGRDAALARVVEIYGVVLHLRQLLEGDAGALEVSERHDLVVGAVHERGVIYAVGGEGYGRIEHFGVDVGAPLRDDVQTLVVCGVEHARIALHARHGGIVVGQHVDLRDAVDGIVVAYGTAAVVVSREVALDDHLDANAAVAPQRVDKILDVVDREVVISAVVEVCGDAFALLVEHRDVEYVAGAYERRGGVDVDDGLERAVAEVVRDGIYTVWLSLPRAVGDVGAVSAARGVDIERGGRGVVSARVHVCLEVLDALLGERHVEQHGLLAHLALEVVPPVVLVGVCQIVCPDVEVRAEETFVWGLADILFECGCGYPLLLRGLPVCVDGDLLEEVLAVVEAARDAARRAEYGEGGDGGHA